MGRVAWSLLNRIAIMKSQLRTSDRHARVTLLALTTAVLILVMAGVLFAAERHAPSMVGAAPGTPTKAMSGWHHVVYGDAPRRGGHMQTHLLVDDKGHATKLAVPDSVVAAADGRAVINRRRVTVAGQLLPGPSAAGSAGNPLVAVHSIVPDARQGVPGAPGIVAGAPGGERRARERLAGSMSARIVILSNDPNESPVQVFLSGVGSGTTALRRDRQRGHE